MSSNSLGNHTHDKQIGLSLHSSPIFLSLVWFQTKLDSTQSFYHYLLYIELTISFRIGWKRRVNFRKQSLWRHPAADYAIIMSRILKTTDYHVMYDHSALWVACRQWRSKNRTSIFCSSMYNKTIIRFSLKTKRRKEGNKTPADNPYLGLDYSGYHKNVI